uniref:Glycosyltransferase n=1 Tax=Nicotiana tabacum TaxID=4097 RepID=A0A1S4C7H4_TOBAC|nr:UDP-glucosyltransferase 29-like [Nicotiana tomentosiformis]XP_016496899.1 PREDICTED: beta-D-glucosyl crocetin beta-1,6-glucosyltransferase-like [Nicotiana tabacum]
MEEIQDTNTTSLKVLMVPWLAHGHVIPYLELAKKLSKTNLFFIYFCSTPIILNSINQENLPKNIQLIEFPLPSSKQLPSHNHTTNGLPKNLLSTLIQTFGEASSTFGKILDSLNPDLLIFDGFQPWAPEFASSRNIHAIYFLVVGSASISFFYHHYLYVGTRNFPFSGIFLKDYEAKQLQLAAKMNSLGPNVAFNGVEKSHDIILINTCNEIEGKYVDYLSTLSKKKVIPVGPLIREMKTSMENEGNDSKIIQWLDNKDESSCVYVSFGSEYFLSKEEIEEIAHSLELSELHFIWILRFPLGEEINIENVLSKGFLDRVKEKGVIVEKWAPQARILEHASVGGFLCHCGWNSILESLHFGVPLITMPMHLDQHTHSRMTVELGTAMEVVRDENGKLNREETAKVIRNVVMEKNGGEIVKAKVIPVGPLVRDSNTDESSEIIQWLNEKDPASTVLVSFGSLRLGLEEEDPQARILAHSSIGGFVSHCGWSSVMDRINSRVPIMAMPLQFDQCINARLMGMAGAGVEVIKAGDGGLNTEDK